MRFELGPDDKFIIIASDGVWEFLSNEMIAKIVWPFYLKNSPE
jgi:serine/threonine protein phosphatase PrpC